MVTIVLGVALVISILLPAIVWVVGAKVIRDPDAAEFAAIALLLSVALSVVIIGAILEVQP